MNLIDVIAIIVILVVAGLVIYIAWNGAPNIFQVGSSITIEGDSSDTTSRAGPNGSEFSNDFCQLNCTSTTLSFGDAINDSGICLSFVGTHKFSLICKRLCSVTIKDGTITLDDGTPTPDIWSQGQTYNFTCIPQRLRFKLVIKPTSR